MLNNNVVTLIAPETLPLAAYEEAREMAGCLRVWDFGLADTVAFARGDGWEGFLREHGYDPQRGRATYCVDGRWFLTALESGAAS